MWPTWSTTATARSRSSTRRRACTARSATATATGRHDRAQAVEVVGRHADHQPGLQLRLQPAEGELPELERVRPACSRPTSPACTTPDTHTVVLQPDPVLQPGLLHRRRAQRDPAAAAARLGQGPRRPARSATTTRPRPGPRRCTRSCRSKAATSRTFTTNPLWKVVDGPWTAVRLQQRRRLQATCRTRTTRDRTSRPGLGRQRVYTTDTAELDALRSGSTLNVGSLPLNDVQQAAELKAEGYSGRQPAGPRRGRHHPEPLQRQGRPGAAAALHPAGDGGPDQPAADRLEGLRRLRRPGQRPGPGARASASGPRRWRSRAARTRTIPSKAIAC